MVGGAHHERECSHGTPVPAVPKQLAWLEIMAIGVAPRPRLDRFSRLLLSGRFSVDRQRMRRIRLGDDAEFRRVKHRRGGPVRHDYVLECLSRLGCGGQIHNVPLMWTVVLVVPSRRSSTSSKACSWQLAAGPLPTCIYAAAKSWDPLDLPGEASTHRNCLPSMRRPTTATATATAERYCSLLPSWNLPRLGACGPPGG